MCIYIYIYISSYSDNVVSTGEMGVAVDIDKQKLSPEELSIYEAGFKNNAFNQYASDMISLHRRLPDARDKL